MLWKGWLALLACLSCQSVWADDLTQSRVAVVKLPGKGYSAYRSSNGQLLKTSQSSSSWSPVTACPGGHVTSNPVSLVQATRGLVFAQAADGQVYAITDEGSSIGSWRTIGSSKLPAGSATNNYNSLTVITLRENVHVFVKTTETSAQLYWTQGNNETLDFGAWVQVGGTDHHLSSPAAVAVNFFTQKLEAVAVMTNGDMYHTWQESENSFHSWDKLGLFEPHFSSGSAPQLRSNHGDSIFNGRLELFIYGDDGHVHHVAQTTCDKVRNPWGPCTWGFYEKLTKHPLPPPLSTKLPIVIATNVHGGLELFSVDKSHQLWHIWQIEQGKSYQGWEKVGNYQLSSPPTLYQDVTGYWHAYALDASSDLVDIPQNFTFRLTPQGAKLPSGSRVNVSWSVPEDEATNMDWIGVYQQGASNDKYLDFAYVQGKQNPLHNAIPKGGLSLRSVLPDGVYDYRYLVNRKFIDVMGSSASFFNGSRASEGTQLYYGMAIGLGKEDLNFDECVEDANHTVTIFREAFQAFEDREIVKGLQLLGEGLKDVQQALIVCNETEIAKQVEKFIGDLIECTEGHCLHFIIDVVGELVSVLYENVHEIYGDIRGAQNCFKIQAYEQAGIDIGRTVAACIEGPSF